MKHDFWPITLAKGERNILFTAKEVLQIKE